MNDLALGARCWDLGFGIWFFGGVGTWNHPNFANPGNNISDAGTFGFIAQTTGVGERNIRLEARIRF